MPASCRAPAWLPCSSWSCAPRWRLAAGLAPSSGAQRAPREACATSAAVRCCSEPLHHCSERTEKHLRRQQLCGVVRSPCTTAISCRAGLWGAAQAGAVWLTLVVCWVQAADAARQQAAEHRGCQACCLQPRSLRHPPAVSPCSCLHKCILTDHRDGTLQVPAPRGLAAWRAPSLAGLHTCAKRG